VVRDEAHQVELAQHADHGAAVAHEHPVHAVAQHQQQRLEQLGVGVDADQLEARHLPGAARAAARRAGRWW